ncbi:MAG: hypothetical protein ACFFDN_00165 [Candidatus Hodarchaeota archaeon]
MNLRTDRYKGSWFTPSLFGKPYKYTILKGEALIREFFVCDYELMEWVKKTLYFCGVEGSGKTNWLRFLTWVLNQIDFYRKHGIISVLTNDIRILGDPNYAYLFNDKAIINLMCDDALGGTGTDSTRFMGDDAKDVSEKFVQSRHYGEEYTGNVAGAVFMAFATQAYKKLNPVIRENATLKIFTSYMDTDYFHNLFPPEETEYLRETHHNAHIGFDPFAIGNAICRTSAGGIAPLEIPFIPYNKETLEWSRTHLIRREKDYDTGEIINKKYYVDDIIKIIPIKNKKDFLKQKSHYNKIYIIDRSLTKDKVIDEMSHYLLTHPKLNYLIKYYEKRNSLEDFSRGKLKGVLREKTRQLKEEYNVSITISDVRTAIDQALRDEEYTIIDKIKKGEINSKEVEKREIKTHKDRIEVAFDVQDADILHISELMTITKLERAKIDSTISKYQNSFINILPGQGYFTIPSRNLTEEEIQEFIESHNLNRIKPIPKKLMIEEWEESE